MWDEPTSLSGSMGGRNVNSGSTYCNQQSWVWITVSLLQTVASYSNSLRLASSSVEWRYHISLILKATFCSLPQTHTHTHILTFQKLTWLWLFMSTFNVMAFSFLSFPWKAEIELMVCLAFNSVLASRNYNRNTHLSIVVKIKWHNIYTALWHNSLTILTVQKVVHVNTVIVKDRMHSWKHGQKSIIPESSW